MQLLHAKVGANMSYAVASRQRLSGSLLQAVDRSMGDQTAVRVALRMGY